MNKLVKQTAPGPAATFSVFHALYALELISDKSIGRSRLAERMGLGEGVVRTIINRMKKEGIIRVTRAGCTLTGKGLRLWNEYKRAFSKKIELEKTGLAFGNYSFAILVKTRGDMIRSGLKQRDAAIMAGARGATTILFVKNRLTIPSVGDNIDEYIPEAARMMIQLLKPEENDVIVIGSADSSLKAQYGTLAAAWTLIDDCS